MYYNICAILNRTNQIRSSKCIVNYQRDLMCMGNICQLADINNIRVWISQSLNIYCLCVLLNSCLYFFKILRINKGCLDSILWKCVLQQVVRTTVDIFCCYNVISLLCKVLDRVCDRCCTGCYCKCCGATLKCCDPLLEYVLCRVCQTSVNVTCICKSETCSCMIAVSEYIRRCLIDWYCSCICNRIRLFLSYM